MFSQRELLIALAVKFNGNWNEIFKAIKSKELTMNEKEIKELNNSIQSGAITILDEEYPSYLKQTLKPPFVLFYKGDISLIKNQENIYTIVGKRDGNTQSDYDKTETIINGLSKDKIVSNGLANGICRKALETAIKNGNKTIVVLGSGVNNCYPKGNKDIYSQANLVISEYPNGAEPTSEQLIMKNRIMAGICNKVVAINITKDMSSIVYSALEMEKDIMVIPQPLVPNNYANYLIEEGAIPLTSIEQL